MGHVPVRDPLETSATPGSRTGLGLREFMADAVNKRDESWRGRERRDVGTWKEQGPGMSTRRMGYTAGRSAKCVSGGEKRDLGVEG